MVLYSPFLHPFCFDSFFFSNIFVSALAGVDRTDQLVRLRSFLLPLPHLFGGGCLCREIRLASLHRDASPPAFSHPAPSSFEPNLNISGPGSASITDSSTFHSPTDSRAKDVATSSSTSTIPPPSPASSTSHTPNGNDASHTAPSPLHPRVAVILGVDRRWYVPLLVCRALSTAPAAWWGLRCAFTFLAELLHIRPGMGREGWAAAIIGSVGQAWDVERRFRVTEVALAIMWVCSALLLCRDFC